MDDIIRSIVRDHGRLARRVDALEPGTDLYRAGLTSHASVNVMLALEDDFDVEFPDDLLRKHRPSSPSPPSRTRCNRSASTASAVATAA